ncbi:MAG: DUF1697 domain-containing protein [Methanocella sp.]
MKKAPEENSLKKYAAFLRGINVGGHSVIKMAELRTAFQSLGFRNVKTVLASGNVLFEAPEENTTVLSLQISRGLAQALMRDITVIVQPVDALLALVARQPFTGIDIAAGARPIVTFIADGLKDPDVGDLPVQEGFRILSVSGGTICSVSYDRYGVDTSAAMGLIEKTFGRQITTRSWDTILRLLKASDNA